MELNRTGTLEEDPTRDPRVNQICIPVSTDVMGNDLDRQVADRHRAQQVGSDSVVITSFSV